MVLSSTSSLRLQQQHPLSLYVCGREKSEWVMRSCLSIQHRHCEKGGEREREIIIINERTRNEKEEEEEKKTRIKEDIERKEELVCWAIVFLWDALRRLTWLLVVFCLSRRGCERKQREENEEKQARKKETIAERHCRQKEDDGLPVVIIVVKQKKT